MLRLYSNRGGLAAPSTTKESFLQPLAPLTTKKPIIDNTMALLLTLQLLFYILVIFPFAVALPVGDSAFGLPNDVSLGFDSSFSFLDGTAQLDPIKREFTKTGINSPRKPLPITADAKANVLSERSRGPTRPLEKPEEKVNLMAKACEHVVRVDKQDKPQSARRSLESSAPHIQSFLLSKLPVKH